MYACASSQTCKHNRETVINICDLSFPGSQEPKTGPSPCCLRTGCLKAHASRCPVAVSRTLSLFCLEGLFLPSLLPSEIPPIPQGSVPPSNTQMQRSESVLALGAGFAQVLLPSPKTALYRGPSGTPIPSGREPPKCTLHPCELL